MEAEIRAIVTAAADESEPADLFTTLFERFGALGGVQVPLLPRTTPARAADFS